MTTLPNTLTLKILASDIREDNYMDQDNCPITKALARAGYSEYIDAGTAIRGPGHLPGLSRYINYDNYRDMRNKMFAMMKSLQEYTLDGWEHLAPIPIEDFEFTLIKKQ